MSHKTKGKTARRDNLGLGVQSGEGLPGHKTGGKPAKRDNSILILGILGIVVVAVIAVVVYAGHHPGGPDHLASPTPATVVASKTPAPAVASTSVMSFNDLKDKPAPAFSLTDLNGKVYTRESLRGKTAVLFFTEGLMCYPACWNQIIGFDRDARFKGWDIMALSIVVDPKEEWQNAIKKLPELGQGTVLFDVGGAVSTKFGMLTAKSSMHFGAMPGHTYVLMDKDGIVRYIFDDVNMGVRNDLLITEIQKLTPSAS